MKQINKRAPGTNEPGTWLLWASAILAVFVMSLKITTLLTGESLQTDDLMRLQQVRDLLAGQSWFDVHQHRMLTPEGGDMHWSRIPDIFLASLIFILKPFVGEQTAELIAMIVWPVALFAIAILLVFKITRRLGTNRMGQLSGLLLFVSSTAFFNFWPGRIDHHGLVVVLVLGAFAALLSSDETWRPALTMALCSCMAISVAIEAVPYVFSILSLAGLFWIMRGHEEAVRMAVLGIGLSLFASLFYLIDAPGLGAGRRVCDAYGLSHWATLWVGGWVFTAIGIFGGNFALRQSRMIVGLLGAALTLSVFVWVAPSCFGNPYSSLPANVQLAWLSNIAEAQSFTRLVEQRMDQAIWVFGFLLAALIAAVLIVVQSNPEHRLHRLSLLVMLAVATALSVWQVRGQTFSHTFGAIAASGLIGILYGSWKRKPGAISFILLLASSALLSPTSWRILGDALFTPTKGHQLSSELSDSCTNSERIRELADMPQMRIHTPIDLAIPILAQTPHQVFAGPYHRNANGILRTSLVLTGEREMAHERLIAMGATHLVFCSGLPETDRYADRWSDSLAAQLSRGNHPAWLVPLNTDAPKSGLLVLYHIEPKPKQNED